MRVLAIFLIVLLYLAFGNFMGFIMDPAKQVFNRRIERVIFVIFWPIWLLGMLFEWVLKA